MAGRSEAARFRAGQAMKPALSVKQKKLFSFILQYLVDNGMQPAGSEMMTYMGVSSPNAITCLLNGLEKKGYIERNQCRARGLKIIEWSAQ